MGYYFSMAAEVSAPTIVRTKDDEADYTHFRAAKADALTELEYAYEVERDNLKAMTATDVQDES